MTKYIQGKDGKFAGSIGDGKDKAPTEAPRLKTFSRKCDNCGAQTRDWEYRRWDSGDVETYCAACTATEQGIAESHSARLAEQRFLAAQDKWTNPEEISAAMWVEESTSYDEEAEEDLAVIEVGLENTPNVPFEMLHGEVHQLPEDGGYEVSLGWQKTRSEFEMGFIHSWNAGKYEYTTCTVAIFKDKDEAVAYTKKQIIERMPRDIKFMRNFKDVPATAASVAAANGYTLTSDKIRRTGINGANDLAAAAPVLTFQSKPTREGELTRCGYITGLSDGTYRAVVRYDDGARSTPAHGIFNTPEEAQAFTLNLLQKAPEPGFGQR